MSDSDNSWADHTVICESDLLNHVIELGSWSDSKLSVSSYCVRPNIDTLDVSGFVKFLKSNYPRFVFSQEEIKEYEWPFVEAQKRADFDDDPRYDGKLGELILFVLVDAVLDLPMVSHKVALKQEPVQEVKGSDGLFYGEFEGEEALAIGEAKMYTNRNQGIESALDSTARFHGPRGNAKTGHELNVASKNLSSNLSREKVERLIEVFTSTGSQYRELHPVFLGYEEEWLGEIQKECTSSEELETALRSRVEDSELEQSIKEKIETDYPDLEKYWLVFFLFPLENIDEFREQLQEEIFPHSTNH